MPNIRVSISDIVLFIWNASSMFLKPSLWHLQIVWRSFLFLRKIDEVHLRDWIRLGEWNCENCNWSMCSHLEGFSSMSFERMSCFNDWFHSFRKSPSTSESIDWTEEQFRHRHPEQIDAEDEQDFCAIKHSDINVMFTDTQKVSSVRRIVTLFICWSFAMSECWNKLIRLRKDEARWVERDQRRRKIDHCRTSSLLCFNSRGDDRVISIDVNNRQNVWNEETNVWKHWEENPIERRWHDIGCFILIDWKKNTQLTERSSMFQRRSFDDDWISFVFICSLSLPTMLPTKEKD